MYSLHIRKNRKISLYHDTAVEVDMDMPYSVRGSREHGKFMIYSVHNDHHKYIKGVEQRMKQICKHQVHFLLKESEIMISYWKQEG